MTHVFSIIPYLTDLSGHLYEYHQAVSNAATHNQWAHTAFVSKGCTLEKLPPNWKKILPNGSLEEKNRFYILKNAGELFFFFFRFLNEKRKENFKKILFFESFRLYQIVPLLLASLFFKNPFKLWLLHRYPCSQMLFQGKIHRMIYFLMEKSIGRENFYLLTDSDLLAQSHQKTFQRPISILSIPHTDTSEKKKEQSPPFLLWWPGSRICPSRGLEKIQTFASLLSQEDSSTVTLILPQGMEQKISQKTSSIHYLHHNLTRDEYVFWMQKVHCVLLPYDPEIYQASTSGVFIEAVVSGALPFVTKNTWMEQELVKYHLEELSFDRDEALCLKKMLFLYQDPIVQEKFSIMKEKYRSWHSLESFSKKLAQLLL